MVSIALKMFLAHRHLEYFLISLDLILEDPRNALDMDVQFIYRDIKGFDGILHVQNSVAKQVYTDGNVRFDLQKLLKYFVC